MAPPLRTAYTNQERCCGVCVNFILGALPIPKGAVPVLARGLGHTAPTYTVGSRIEKPRTAHVARSLFMPEQEYECMPTSHPQQKDDLRKETLKRRDAMDESVRIEHSLAAAEHGRTVPALSQDVLAVGTIVAGFHPIRSEIDPRPLMADLVKLGARLCLPVVTDPRTIEFRELVQGAKMIESGFGTIGPDENAQVLNPDILLVPLSVFDRKGGRIGYGAGFYDRAIERLEHMGKSLHLIGMAFSTQEAPEVPMEKHDRYLDGILTETGYIPTSS